MGKLSLAVAAVTAVLCAMFAPSFAARAQSPARFDYLRVTPIQAVISTPGRIEYRWVGYRACVAASSEWTCRDFNETEQNQNQNPALRTALVTLGNEGWELVSAIDEQRGSGGGLTYLFKRQRQ